MNDREKAARKGVMVAIAVTTMTIQNPLAAPIAFAAAVSQAAKGPKGPPPPGGGGAAPVMRRPVGGNRQSVASKPSGSCPTANGDRKG